MKNRKSIFIFFIFIIILLISYMILKENHSKDVYSNQSFGLQNDLVQLEGSIDYQIKNGWNDVDSVIEKIEDIREDINRLMVLGKDLGLITSQQEDDLWNLDKYFSNYPTYSGYPNTILDNNEIDKLTQLQEDLRSAGWGMNIGYSSGWTSFSKKIDELID